MGLQELIARVVGRHRERAQQVEATFADLVVQIADGDEPDADHVETILATAGKSVTDLQKAVERLFHRRQLRATVDAATEAQEQRADVLNKIAAADAVLAAAREQHARTVRPLQAEIASIDTAAGSGMQAETELRQTSAPELRQQITDVQRRMRVVVVERDRWAEDAERSRLELRRREAEVNEGGSASRPGPDYRDAMARAQQSVDDARYRRDQRAAEVKRLDDELHALEAEAARLEALQLEP